MVDNVSIKDGSDTTVAAAADELSDSSFSPKVSLLDGTGSPTPISPATEGTLADVKTALETAGGLVVNLGTNNDVTVTGTVTANAGTNLNTSTLATQTTLASLLTNLGRVTPLVNLDVDESEDAVKASAGALYFIHAMNLTSAILYLKFYNATVANVTVGTTAPVLSFPVPTLGDTNGAGFCLSIPTGITFSTAITVACTTGLANSDTGAPAANAMVINLGYI